MIYHLDLDAFFASVEELLDPALASQPLAVGGTDRRGVVATANYHAREWGVSSAMPMVQARQKCPSLVTRPARHHVYKEVSRRVFSVLKEYTPCLEVVSIDEAYAALPPPTDDPQAFAVSLQGAVYHATGLPISVGGGSTKLAAKLATEQAKPNGVWLVPAEEELAFLHRHPVRDIPGVGPVTEEKLASLHIFTLGQVARVRPAVLEAALGAARGRMLAAYAQGQDLREVDPNPHPPKQVSRERTLPTDALTFEEAETELFYLAGEVAQRLAATDRLPRVVLVKLRTPSFVTYTRSRTVPRGVRSQAELYHYARDLVGELWGELYDPTARLLGVGVEGFRPVGQLSFDPVWYGEDEVSDPATLAVGAVVSHPRHGPGMVDGFDDGDVVVRFGDLGDPRAQYVRVMRKDSLSVVGVTEG